MSFQLRQMDLPTLSVNICTQQWFHPYISLPPPPRLISVTKIGLLLDQHPIYLRLFLCYQVILM